MGSAFTFDVDTRKIVKVAFKRAPKEVGKAVEKAMLDIGRKFERHLAKNRLRGGTSNTKLGTRTGALRRSLGVRTSGTGLDTAMHVGFGPPAAQWSGGAERYAPVHEGLVKMPIKPKRSKFLAIPVAENLTGAGVARISSPRMLSDPEFVPHLFSSGFGYLVFQDDQLMFLLVREVNVKARLNFRKDWTRKRKGFQKMLLTAVAKAVTKVQRS